MRVTNTFYRVKVNGQKVAETVEQNEVQGLVVDAIRTNGIENVSWEMVFQNKMSNGFVLEEDAIDGQMPTQQQVDEFGG